MNIKLFDAFSSDFNGIEDIKDYFLDYIEDGTCAELGNPWCPIYIMYKSDVNIVKNIKTRLNRDKVEFGYAEIRSLSNFLFPNKKVMDFLNSVYGKMKQSDHETSKGLISMYRLSDDAKVYANDHGLIAFEEYKRFLITETTMDKISKTFNFTPHDFRIILTWYLNDKMGMNIEKVEILSHSTISNHHLNPRTNR